MLILSVERSTIVLQGGVAFAGGALATSRQPGVSVGAALVALVWAAGLARWQWRRRTVQNAAPAVLLDLALSCLVLLLMVPAVAPAERHTSWLAWAFSFSLSSAALAGLAAPRLAVALTASAAPALVYAAVVIAPASLSPGDRAAGAANAVAYPAFALVVWVIARTLRRLADDADASRELAAQLAAELEQRRSRRELHNVLPFLALDDVIGADPEQLARRVADAEVKRRALRRLVDGATAPGDVRALLEDAVLPYSDLALTVVVLVEAGTALRDDAAVALRQAVESALANVQQSAPGAAVTLTALEGDGEVEVSVVDDGPGFDPALVTPGFGIRELLGQQVRDVGGRAEVASTPGLGTRVSVVVPVVRS